MRLWTLHPRYLDPKGLTALWREALLAQRVLSGATEGYTRHPQLNRFRSEPRPTEAIAAYLRFVWMEASARGYSFNRALISACPSREERIPTTAAQLEFERLHLLGKLDGRNRPYADLLRREETIELHPLFVIYDGSLPSIEKSA